MVDAVSGGLRPGDRHLAAPARAASQSCIVLWVPFSLRHVELTGRATQVPVLCLLADEASTRALVLEAWAGKEDT
jgi:hypothetical protein